MSTLRRTVSPSFLLSIANVNNWLEKDIIWTYQIMMHGDAAATNNLPTSTSRKEIQSIELNPFKLLSKRSWHVKEGIYPTSPIIQNLRLSIFRNFTWNYIYTKASSKKKKNYIYTPHDQLIKLINYLYTEDIIICLLDKSIGDCEENSGTSCRGPTHGYAFCVGMVFTANLDSYLRRANCS